MSHLPPELAPPSLPGLDAEWVEAFAFAVVKRNGMALRINAENRPDGWVPIPQAAKEGCAFAVEPRDGVIALDVDGIDDHTWAQRAARSARARGLGLVRVGSGRQGHEHLWLVGRVGWSSRDLARLANEAGAPTRSIRHTQGTRPPLSPHRLGGSGQLIEPTDVNQALAALRQPSGHVVPLTVRMQVLLAHGDREGCYQAHGRPSRSVLTSALALAYVNAGMTFEHLRADLADPANMAGEKYRGLGSRGREWLLQKWADACSLAKAKPPVPSNRLEQERLAQARQSLSSRVWRGQAGGTDRAVYAALLDLAELRMLPLASCSTRRLTELVAEQYRASITRRTVIRSLQRLEASGLITTEIAPTAGHSTVYRLHPERGEVDTINPSTGGHNRITTGDNTPRLTAAPDAFLTRAGITAGAWVTLQSMPQGEWVKTSDIRHRHPGLPALETLRRHLHELFRSGLVDHEQARKQSWRRLPDSKANLILDRWAFDHGLLGEGVRAIERLKITHAVDRLKWASPSTTQ